VVFVFRPVFEEIIEKTRKHIQEIGEIRERLKHLSALGLSNADRSRCLNLAVTLGNHARKLKESVEKLGESLQVPVGETRAEEGVPIAVDGANVIHYRNAPSVGRLMRMMRALKSEGFKPVAIVGPGLRIFLKAQAMASAAERKEGWEDAENERVLLEEMVKDGQIIEAPAGTDADFWLIKYAQAKDCKIVSNDRFENWKKAFPFLSEPGRVVRFMEIEGEVILDMLGESCVYEKKNGSEKFKEVVKNG
jgi:hypothetical protein